VAVGLAVLELEGDALVIMARMRRWVMAMRKT